MEVQQLGLPVTGFSFAKLDEDVIEFLWRMIEKARSEKVDYKKNIVSNISESYQLTDENSIFANSVCIPLAKEYLKRNSGKLPVFSYTSSLKPESRLILKELWVNFQYKNEFTPYHKHNGVFSFAIWMKIPYEFKKQCELPQFKGTKEENIRAGCFEFEYLDTIGSVRNFKYPLSPDMEGKMVFFPASLRHCVYPFFGTDEPRISIAGNLLLD